MEFRKLPLGTKLELEVISSSHEQKHKVLISELEWFEDNGIAAVAVPIVEGVLTPVQISSYVNIYFFWGGNLYKTNGKVTGRDSKSIPPTLKLQVEDEIERIQRRSFFRFNHIVPVTYRLVSSLDNNEEEVMNFEETITHDIGGGGLCIKTMDKLEMKSLIQGQLTLDETKIDFIGRIVRVTKLGNEGRYNFEIGVEFLKIPHKEREKVIGFIFKEQRKLRKKGLI